MAMSKARTQFPRVALVVALFLSAACGSTLQRTGTQVNAAGDELSVDSVSAGADSGDGLSESSDTDGSSAAGSNGSTSNGSGSSPGGTARAGASAPSPGAGAGAGAGAPNGAAAETKPIKIGVIGVDVTALFAVFGATGNSDRVFDGFNRLLDYMNKTGGIAGRQLEGVYETIDIAEDYNAAAQRACERFTTDDKVDFVMPTGWNEVLLSCLEQHGVAAFEAGSWTNDRGTLDHPNWITPFGLPVDRYAVALIEFGIDEGFLKRGVTLGVLYEDCPWGGRVYNGVVKPTAEKYGLKTVNATTKCVENLVSDLGPVTNQVQQAALKFNSSGVTHVLTLTGAEGFFIAQFQKAAVQQEYHPKYLFTTNGFPYNNTHPESDAVYWEPSELKNMIGLGNNPYIDVGRFATPADASQDAAQAKCREADPKTWQDTNPEEPGKWQVTAGFYGMCDLFFLIREMAAVNGGRFDIASLRDAYRSVIGTRTSAMLTGGRHRLIGEKLEATGFMQPIRFDGGTQPPVYYGSIRTLS